MYIIILILLSLSLSCNTEDGRECVSSIRRGEWRGLARRKLRVDPSGEKCHDISD